MLYSLYLFSLVANLSKVETHEESIMKKAGT